MLERVMQLVAGGSAAAPPLVMACLLFAVVVPWLSIVDIRRLLLPDRILLPTLVLALTFLLSSAALAGDGAVVLRIIAAEVTCCAFYAFLHVLCPHGLGLGDVKLAALLGVYLGYSGWPAVLAGMSGGFLAGGLAGALLLVRRGRGAELPFGPFMAIGAAAAMLLPG